MSRGRFQNLPVHDGRPPEILVLQLPPPAIQYLTAHVEASDGIGVVRTLDEDRGIIECWVMPDYKEEFDALLNWTATQWPIQRLGREFE
ncbi:MAG: DUF4911 domain-containing protein [Candidatus Sumerlaeia bacterium]